LTYLTLLDLERLSAIGTLSAETDDAASGLDIIEEVVRTNLVRLASHDGSCGLSSNSTDMVILPESPLSYPVLKRYIVLQGKVVELADVELLFSFNNKRDEVALQLRILRIQRLRPSQSGPIPLISP
jgi:hypothetical protein